MNDYEQVRQALTNGVSTNHLCMTCPWDRLCVSPPTMTHQDVQDHIKKASDEDDRQHRENGPGGDSIPLRTIMSTLVFSGKDKMAEICPVFAVELRTSKGRDISDGLKGFMQDLSK